MTTAVALGAYSGEARIWRAGIPGSTLMAAGYGAVTLINVAFAWVGVEVLNGRYSGGSRRLLSACAVAFLALLGPAVAIGTVCNDISRQYLDLRRPDIYRAANQDAALAFSTSALTGRRDIGHDLRNLLGSQEFREALRHQPFYRMDFDERFQVLDRAVTFGYRDPAWDGERPFFRLIRFPEDVVRAIGFESLGPAEGDW